MNLLYKLNLHDKKTLIILISSIAALVAIIVTVIVLLVGGAKDGEVPANTTEIFVSTPPTKLHYYVGESAEFDGLTIKVCKSNGKSYDVVYSEETKAHFNFLGFDSSKPYEEQKITVEYGGFSCYYYIVIKEIPKPAPVLVSISIDEMPKTEYKVREWIDLSSGMLRLHYSDGSSKRTIIMPSYISGWDEAFEAGVGTYTLTVKYKEGGVLKSTTFDVTIVE